MKKIGITGGIGSGKSFVCNIISTLGFPIYDCDRKAKELMTSDAALAAGLKRLVGSNAYNSDGTINREVIANFLFANKANAEKINRLVHPAVKKDFLQWASQQDSTLVFVESAILFEAQFDDAVDCVIAVCAPIETRIRRAIQRDNTTKEKVEERIRQQMSDNECRMRADFTITNDGDADIQKQIDNILSLISKRPTPANTLANN